MKIETASRLRDEKFARECLYKFVLEKIREDLMLTLLDTGGRHSDHLTPDSDFIGAGFIRKNTHEVDELEWGSESCEEERGYDRPDDDDQELLASEILQTVNRWLQEVSEQVQ